MNKSVNDITLLQGFVTGIIGRKTNFVLQLFIK